MRKKYSTLALALGLVLLTASFGMADVIPTPWSMSFLGEVTYNGGELLPLGSVVDAYDPDGVHCGRDYVENIIDSSGIYGSMPVYGDDLTWTPDVDEGAESGDLISFKINGRDATPTVIDGSLEWQDKAQATVNLSATDFTFGMTLVDPPSNAAGNPGTTIRFHVGVENTGNGIDFYTIVATSANGWTVTIPSEYVYANPGESVYLWFDVDLPGFSPDMFDEISYTVYSQTAMPTASVSGSVQAIRDHEVVYSAAIIDAPDDVIASPAELVTVLVGIGNVGNVPDMYSISAVSDLGWTTNPVIPFTALDPGQSDYVAFTVQVPMDATNGDISEITYTVQSAGDPTLTLEGTLIITIMGTDVDDHPLGSLPDQLVLAQNYPNPFNPTTTIGFNLPNRSQVSISVIDILGRTVDTIDLGNMSAGVHHIEYDGSRLSSGVYFYRIATADGSQTKKMALVK